jgi:hypothetical protein
MLCLKTGDSPMFIVPVAVFAWVGQPSGRVFFANEATAIAAGYRPCAKCMKDKYLLWKSQQESQKGFLLSRNMKIHNV